MGELADDSVTPSPFDLGYAPTEVITPGAGAIALVPGQRLGNRYRVRGLLGKGGMGAVYRALDEELGEEVALKLVRGRLGDHAALREEVRLAQKVTHRNVVRTYDLETVGDHIFVKMELVTGRTLAKRIARAGRLPIAAVVHIARSIADGLAAAHAVGIVHRDLKPSNVMIGDRERVVLMDFGLARQGSDGGERCGTPGYMAPEQLAGTGATPRSDLYALGCLAYEMLTGDRVFGGDTVEQLVASHVHEAPPDVRVKRRTVPRWLARAVALLLAKAPDLRPAGVALLMRGPQRLPWIAGGALAAVAAGGAVAWYAHARAPWQPVIVDLPAHKENSGPPSVSPDGRTLVFAADREQPGFRGHAMALDGSDARLVLPGVELADLRWTRDGRAVLYSAGGAVYRQALTPALEPVGSPEALGPGSEPAPCGDDAVLIDDRAVIRRRADGTRAVIAPSTGELTGDPRCDAAGERVVFWRGRRPTGFAGGDIFLAEHGGVRRLTTGRGSTQPVFAGRDAIVFSSRRGGTISLYEVAVAGGEAHRLTFGPGPDLGAEITPDGARLVFNRDVTAEVVREHARGGEVRHLTSKVENLIDATPIPGAVLAVRLDPDGDVVVAITGGMVRELASGGHPLDSQTGGRALFRRPSEPRTVFAVPLGGGAATTLATFPAPVLDGIDAADGVHVVIRRGERLEGWRLRPGGLPESDGDGADGLVVPAPRGGWRAVVRAADGTVVVRLVAPGAPLGDGLRLAVDSPRVVWLDDYRLAVLAAGEFRIVDAPSARVVDRFAATPGAELAADGVHWYDTATVGQVTRHVIANFGDRPWR